MRDFIGIADSGVAHCLVRLKVFKADLSFSDFVHAVASIPDQEADEHFRSQTEYVKNPAGLIAIDYVGRYEKLANDFSDVARHIGLPEGSLLPRLQAATQKHYAAYYTAETRAIVEVRYARDVELFNYRFSSD